MQDEINEKVVALSVKGAKLMPTDYDEQEDNADEE